MTADIRPASYRKRDEAYNGNIEITLATKTLTKNILIEKSSQDLI